MRKQQLWVKNQLIYIYFTNFITLKDVVFGFYTVIIDKPIALVKRFFMLFVSAIVLELS